MSSRLSFYDETLPPFHLFFFFFLMTPPLNVQQQTLRHTSNLNLMPLLHSLSAHSSLTLSSTPYSFIVPQFFHHLHPTSTRSLPTIFILRLCLPREQPRPLFGGWFEKKRPSRQPVDPSRYRCVNFARQTLALTRNFLFLFPKQLFQHARATVSTGKQQGVLGEISKWRSPLTDLGQML